MKRRISRRERVIFGWSAISSSATFTSGSVGTILGFLGEKTLRVIVADFPNDGRETLSSTKAESGNFVLSTCGPCSATDNPLGSPAGQASDLSGKSELDRVNDAALARSVRTRDREGFLPEVDVKLPDAQHFLRCARFRA
jgi:hypothetical protein